MRNFLSRLAGITEDNSVRSLQPLVDEINALEEHFSALSDEQIRTEMAEIRDEVREAAPASEPSDDELHSPDSEVR